MADDQFDSWREEALTSPGDFKLPEPEPLTNERLGQFNYHILLTVQAVQQLNTALTITRFL